MRDEFFAKRLAVLISGGLDSAVLLAESLRVSEEVFPVYVRFGLSWEEVEREYLRRFLEAIASVPLRPLTVLEAPARPLYGSHWSLTGKGVPAADSPDEDVYLPGRNVLLLSQAMIWCHLHGVGAVSLGSLQTNPFADATSEFFGRFEAIVNQALGGGVKILLPYGGVRKREVMVRGRHLPLQHTFSCMQPQGMRHCGSCNKCAERQKAFREVEIEDPTEYARKLPG